MPVCILKHQFVSPRIHDIGIALSLRVQCPPNKKQVDGETYLWHPYLGIRKSLGEDGI
jgi:hypothetical protein